MYPAPYKKQYETACNRRRASGLFSLLHRQFRLQTGDVAINRGNRQHTALAFVAQQAIALHDVAVDIDLVKGLGVADIVDRRVVMQAPEKRHGIEGLARA